jgi:hypothetical protein
MTIEEFVAKHCSKIRVVAETGCWEWVGAIAKATGYGRYGVYEDGVRVRQPMVHVYVWELAHPDEELGRNDVVGHSCNNPPCMNPFHLTKTTRKGNAVYSVESGRHFQASKTRCVNGHEFTPENTGRSKAGRYCRACQRASSARSRAAS